PLAARRQPPVEADARHVHPAGALDQRLDDQRGQLVGVGLEQRHCSIGLWRVGAELRPWAGEVEVGVLVSGLLRTWQHQRVVEQRAERLAPGRAPADRQRTEGLAVVAVLERRESALARLAPLQPRLKAELERDL